MGWYHLWLNFFPTSWASVRILKGITEALATEDVDTFCRNHEAPILHNLRVSIHADWTTDPTQGPGSFILGASRSVGSQYTSLPLDGSSSSLLTTQLSAWSWRNLLPLLPGLLLSSTKATESLRVRSTTTGSRDSQARSTISSPAVSQVLWLLFPRKSQELKLFPEFASRFV